ncbi:MAG: Gfo/Idh/MocA family oxidoreductase [Candidatus Omnitrophica bacterium]|nr:Gfo/Idh/MocA family oxidoreductase [Candidatus Omnitrophota bacterium]
MMSETKDLLNQALSAKTDRRRFIVTAAQAGAVLAAPSVIPSKALGRDGYVAPSDRIILGGIGIGVRGEYDLRMLLQYPDCQCVAVCDPNRARREKVKALVDARNDNTECATYRDIREFLAERTDIDAVLITTGDRWHAYASILAMRAGKDVYSEKPSSMTIQEGRAVMDTAKRYGRIYQTGTQRLSEANFTFANELLRTGRLGDVHTVRAHIAPWDAAEMRFDWLPEEPEPPKEEMDWDAWLGPCPWRPYNSQYVRGGWRGFYDFHTSCIGEWGAHTFAQCQVAIGAAHTSAIEYGYVNNPTGDGMVTQFANGIRMVLHRDDDNKYWHGSCGVRYEGTEGWVSIADGYDKPEVSTPSLLADFDKLVNEYMARTQRPMNHWRNFLDCIKSRRPCVADAEMMHRSMTTVHAANICMWLKRDVKFDPVKEEFLNDDEANRLRSRAQREPWII